MSKTAPNEIPLQLAGQHNPARKAKDEICSRRGGGGVWGGKGGARGVVLKAPIATMMSGFRWRPSGSHIIARAVDSGSALGRKGKRRTSSWPGFRPRTAPLATATCAASSSHAVLLPRHPLRSSRLDALGSLSPPLSFAQQLLRFAYSCPPPRHIFSRPLPPRHQPGSLSSS